MASQLPILQVLPALLAAPLCAVLPRRWAWALTAAVSVFCAYVALSLLQQTLIGGPISYALGGWAPPVGIEYRVDVLNAIVLVIVACIGALLMLFAHGSVAQEIEEEKQSLFYCLHLLNFAGLLGMAVTGDLFNLFVFLEISSLSTYALIALGPNRRALVASYQYLIVGTTGATFYVIGVGLLYMMTGSLNMIDVADRLPQVADTSTVRTAIAFLVVGLGIKLGMFPLHFWLPNAYAYAPSIISAFLAATATKVAIYALIRVLFTVFGAQEFEESFLAPLMLALGIAAMFLASAAAIFQDNVKRLLAYSSVGQVGYILLGIAVISIAGLTASLLHVFNHALMKGAIFMAMAGVFYRIGSVRLGDMAGLGQAMPWTMAAFMLAGFSLIGVPLTAGFVSKWYLVQAVLEAGHLWLAIAILFSSLLAALYIWRVAEVAYMRPRPDGAATIREAPLSLLIPTWVLVAGNIGFGVLGDISAPVAQAAATALLGGGS